MSAHDGWSREEAGLLVMLTTAAGDLTARELLLRCDGIVSDGEMPSASWQSFAESLGRLAAAGLVKRRSDGRLAATSAGHELSPGGFGRYFKDLITATQLALDEHVRRRDPVDVGISSEAFDRAVAYVEGAKERAHSRRGRVGRDKWEERLHALPLRFTECIEFLTFIAAERLSVEVSDCNRPFNVDGTLETPVRHGSDPEEEPVFTVEVRLAGSDLPAKVIELRPRMFTTADFHSVDGVDFFQLSMTFDDGTSVTFTR